nr:PREDICTED: serine/threonine-protein kinase PRP4 homolog [Bemisia tabaci]
MTWGKASLHNIPWTRGGCFKEKCDCVFNEEQLGGYSLPKCPGTTKTWLPLEHQVNLAEAEYQSQLAKMGAGAQFEVFKQTWGKNYATAEEEEKRFKIFEKNLAEIKRLNDQRAEREDTAVFGVNKFADLTEEEFEEKYVMSASQKAGQKRHEVMKGKSPPRKMSKPPSRQMSKSPSRRISKPPSRELSKPPSRKTSKPPSRKESKTQNLRTRGLNPFKRSNSKDRSQSASPQRADSRGRSGRRSWSPPRTALSADERSFSLGRSNDRTCRMEDDDENGNRRRRRRRQPQQQEEEIPRIIGPDPNGRPAKDWRVPARLYPPVENQDCYRCLDMLHMDWGLAS